VTTSESSGITFQAWLPSEWNGRFLLVGNGGLNGCIYYEDLAYGSSFGFAVAATNNGHNGSSAKDFFHAPEVYRDFVWRATVTGAAIGKELTRSYYDRDPSYSYWLGCSTGGRQGLQYAQRFPDVFDGILAGAPAASGGLGVWNGWQGLLAGLNSSASFVTPLQWRSIQEEFVRQCDGLDGALDGILEDPAMCSPKITPLICNSSSTSDDRKRCLTGEQAARVQTMISDLWLENGTFIHPRMQPGTEFATAAIFRSGQTFGYSTDTIRYVYLGDPDWDASNLTLDLLMKIRANDTERYSTYNPDLSAFRDAGGKLLLYHGQADPLISSFNSAHYYDRVAANMSLSPSDLDEFFRFFRISGLGHCTRGENPGAWDIGNAYTGRPLQLNNAENNVLLALVKWVEEGHAPESITGLGYGPNATTAEEIVVSRKHCKYPARNVYVGPGSHTEESAWKCL